MKGVKRFIIGITLTMLFILMALDTINTYRVYGYIMLFWSGSMFALTLIYSIEWERYE